MKWAQTKDRLDHDGVNDPKERNKFFKEYPTKNDLEADLKDPKKFEEWVTHPDPNDQNAKPFTLNRKAQRRYEVFCGGFLYYHDVVFKKYREGAGYEYPDPGGPNISPKWKEYKVKDEYGNEKIVYDFEHTIYFEWFPKGKKDQEDKEDKVRTSVKIHITPTPPEFNPKPPPPPAPPPPESNP